MARTYHHGDKAKRRRFGKNWRWMNTPSWWIREFMTAPQRREVRDLLAKLDPENPPLFPLAKKPHLYFW